MRDPAFLFYDGDAAKDVSHMNRLERGAYFDFIQAQRKFGGITMEQARKILGKDFDEVWPALELILSKSDSGKYYIEWVQDSIENRAANAEKQRKRIQDYWDKKKKENDLEIPRNNHGKSMDLPLENEIENENENEIELKGGVGEKPKTWKTDFETYKTELLAVYQALIIDPSYITTQEKFHPGVDISLSLEKAVTNFWATEAGWKHKKKQRARDPDWKMTLTNAIDKNKVYKSHGNNDKKATSKDIRAQARKQQDDYGIFKPGDQPGVKHVYIPD